MIIVLKETNRLKWYMALSQRGLPCPAVLSEPSSAVYVCVFVERVWIRFTDIFLKMFPKFIFNWRIIALIGG